jgi:hypothetical protein
MCGLSLTGKYALAPVARALYERSLLFLNSDLEFLRSPSVFKLRCGLLRLLGFGRALKQSLECEYGMRGNLRLQG